MAAYRGGGRLHVSLFWTAYRVKVAEADHQTISPWPAARAPDIERNTENPYTTRAVRACPKIGTKRALAQRRAVLSSNQWCDPVDGGVPTNPSIWVSGELTKTETSKVDHDKAWSISRTRDKDVIRLQIRMRHHLHARRRLTA